MKRVIRTYGNRYYRTKPQKKTMEKNSRHYIVSFVDFGWPWKGPLNWALLLVALNKASPDHGLICSHSGRRKMDHVFGIVRAILPVQSESMHKKGQPRSDLPMPELVDTFSLLFKTLASKTRTSPKMITGMISPTQTFLTPYARKWSRRSSSRFAISLGDENDEISFPPRWIKTWVGANYSLFCHNQLGIESVLIPPTPKHSTSPSTS